MGRSLHLIYRYVEPLDPVHVPSMGMTWKGLFPRWAQQTPLLSKPIRTDANLGSSSSRFVALSIIFGRG